MIVKVGETQKLEVREQTIDGIMVNVWLKAALVNVALDASTDFLPAKITCKTTIYRNGQLKQVLADNMQILGIFSSVNYNPNTFWAGSIIEAQGVATKNRILVSLFIPFGGPINVKGSDQLVTEFLVGQNAMTANVDTGVSFVEFNHHRCIGYETGLPSIRSQVVTPGSSGDDYPIGDNVRKLMFVNIDKTSILNPVIVSCTLTSKQLNQTYNGFDLLNNHWNILTEPVIQWQGYTPTLPKYPQSNVIFSQQKGRDLWLDNCSLNMSFNSADVAAASNYIMSLSIEVTKEKLEQAEMRQEKHAEEKAATIPAK